jgi:acyl-CoA reductase-like NAD-dependent aldehyde dehydrogenase
MNVETVVAPRKHFERLDPLTGKVASVALAMDAADALAVADKAGKALAAWSLVGPNARRALLNKAADALSAKAPKIVTAMMAEIGASETWVRFNIRLAEGMIREAAALTTQISGEIIPSDKPGCLSMAVREPAGVVLGIAPWNAPVILAVRAIVTPLACGNTVILKASEICPETQRLIIESFADAGFPDGVVNAVTHAPEDAAEVVGVLIDHPAVRRINFTGSTHVGRIVAVRAAKNLKPVLLELGGKAPFVILEDADLDEAVKAAAFGAFANQGQVCMSTERIIVVDAVAEAFAKKFAVKVSSLTVGDPRKGSFTLGAVIDRKTVDHITRLAADAEKQGAHRLVAGTAEGVLMAPTVMDRVTPDMRLFREESFGPLVAIVRARDEEHAIELANDTEYGLSACVFTRDISSGLRVARAIKSGICHINGPTVQDEAQIPFGGTKASGYGRFGGKAGIDAFTELRWMTIETQPGHYPF